MQEIHDAVRFNDSDRKAALKARSAKTGTNIVVVAISGAASKTAGSIIGSLENSYSVARSNTFEIGTANGYSPVTINVTTGSGTVIAKAVQGQHPNVSNSQKTIRRYWTLSGGAGITAASLTFQYLAADIKGTESSYVVGQFNGTNVSILNTTVNTTNHNATATGATSLSGDWTIGEELALGVKGTAENAIPKSFFVDQSFPNPFNPSTSITYGLPKSAFVNARLYNILGQEVETLFAGEQTAGIHTINFNASNLSSGIYLYRIQAGNAVDTKRMALIK